ncbi:transcriptional repressor [Phyllobacterium sp. 628]|uniref:iron response transcriptional regulator IrrA n=1 Tax=Phyllobacterium sp. 628 TaxID=2718938 RepID=UPI0016623F72|nr:Fur family transcriptional regulator [Phyllobacterium sp. 628]QND52363.1 transcriptional repressor [Phyllobacterium sp. 628]
MLFIPDQVRQRLLAERDGRFTSSAIRAKIKAAGLRPTKQRLALGQILFHHGEGHVTAEKLHRDATRAGHRISLATVYNTLNQFAEAGLLGKVNLDGDQSCFDINVSDHHHFYVEALDLLIDIPASELEFAKLPAPPAGYKISKINVLIQLQPVADAPEPTCLGVLSAECEACGRCSPFNEKRPRL